jgi:uncharacterized protein (DUF885 family)
MTAKAKLTDLCDRFWAFERFEFPIKAIGAGFDTEDDVLAREAPADYERRAVFARAMLAEAGAVPLEALGAQDRASLELLRRELAGLVRTVEVSAHLRPSIYPLGPEFMIVYFTNTVGLQTVEDARRYLARLATVPQVLDGVREGMEAGLAMGIRYPALVVERAVDQVRGLISTPVTESAFYGPFLRGGRRSDAFLAEAARGEAMVRDVVYPAYAAYADFIQERLGSVARETLSCTESPDGEAFYRSQVETFATVDPDPDEIHDTGLSEVARITGEMNQVAAQAGFENDLAGFRRRLQTDNSQFAESAEALREQIEILSKRIDAKIPQFFGRTPRTTYGVQSIPEAIAEKMPPAYAQPNPADNSSSGVHWITSIPGKCPRYMHLPLALHEAWPGHLMHLALMQEMEDLPAFRRHGAMSYSACLEGWALYSERLGEDMGFYDTPEKVYGRLEMEMWRAVRLVLDTGLHWKNWSRERAIEFFKANMAMPDTTLEAEVDRYIAMPGQALGYQLGNMKFREIRERAEATLGDRFRIRDFHDALMAAGPVTLPVLDDLMTDWIERQVAKAA